MMFQLSDDGVVSSVNEDDLIYVDKNELEKFIESYQELEKENEQLNQYKQSVKDILTDWSNKDLTAHELGIIIAIMKELNEME